MFQITAVARQDPVGDPKLPSNLRDGPARAPGQPNCFLAELPRVRGVLLGIVDSFLRPLPPASGSPRNRGKSNPVARLPPHSSTETTLFSVEPTRT